MVKDSITLIGMPGSGKSMFGKILAKKFNLEFVDGDTYIEQKEGIKLQQIIDKKGDEGFCQIEEKRILELLPLKKVVFAPGGSICYSQKVMEGLLKSSFIVFLDQCLETLESRLGNKATRGIVGLESKTIPQLYEERMPLYKKYAEITIDCSKKSDDKITEEIIKELTARQKYGKFKV